MQKLFLLAPVLLIHISVCAADADAKAEVKAGAKKLSDQPNYSWTATPRAEGASANWRQGPIQGQSEKGGFAYCKFTVGDNDIETAFKASKSAIQRDGNWQSADELDGDNAWIATRLRAFKLPPQEAEDLLDKTREVKKEADGSYSGDLTVEGAREILSRWRRGQSVATDTKGWVKFWIKDGLLTKYQFNIQGKTTLGDDQREVEINRTTTVEIKDVGSTKVAVPEEAKKKLS